jgi:hypothetical protein
MWGDNPCIGDWPYVGYWMASSYTATGQRLDHHLLLNPDDSYRWIIGCGEPGLRTMRGRWLHRKGEMVLRLQPSETAMAGGTFENWEVIPMANWNMVNVLMLRRWLPAEDHNPPILFYRVQPQESQGEPKPADHSAFSISSP